MSESEASRKEKDRTYHCEKRREFMAAHPEKAREYARRYREKHRRAYNQSKLRGNRTYRLKLRSDMITALGGRCVRCGFSEIPALQVDHINGDGQEERRQIKDWRRYRLEVIRSAKVGEGRYQILCANCHCIKHYSDPE